MKKVICFMLMICMILSFAGCKDAQTGGSVYETSEQEAVSSGKTINLLYSYGDTFNPYTAVTSSNRQLSLLLFDPLLKIDNEFNVNFCLASSALLEGTVCTVKLKNAMFSDGTPLTAADVVYTYDYARQSSSDYAAQLYEIASVSAADSKTVVFNLTQHDPYFINLLDLPILKSGTGGGADTDGVEIPPIGCGRYILGADRKFLDINPAYYGKKGSITRIKLINAPDHDSTAHYVEVGTTELYYTDISDGKIVRMSGKKTDVNLNHLVYIGINSSYGSLAQKEMRYAISSALDRSVICQAAYYNNATPASGFYNPSFADAQPIQTIDNKANTQITVENLGKIGYNNMNADGFYGNSAGNNPTFTLLVNSENESRVLAANLIASQCKAAGIEIKVVERSYEQYLAALASGGFQLYLGEIRVLGNMDLAPLVVAGGSAAYGVSVEAEPESANTSEQNSEQNSEQTELGEGTQTAEASNAEIMMKAYHAGECTAGDLAATLITEMPQIPVCYRNGLLFYSSQITEGVTASSSDIYFSLENYIFN